jgi:hypothetical protein
MLTMHTTATTARREVRYESLDEVMADAERLAGGKVRTLGQWSYPQILDHLGKSVLASIDGYGFKAPWVARVFIAPLMKNSFLTKPMKPGFKLPSSASAILPAAEVSLQAALEGLRKAIARLKVEPSRAPHPFLGSLADQEYTALHLRHSELHMSFVIPETA